MRALALTLALLAATAASAQTPGQNSAPQPTQNPTQATPQNGFLFWDISRKSVDFLLQTIPQGNPVRLAQLRQTFTDFQCLSPNLHEQSAPNGKNLLCTLPGTAPPTPAADKPHGAPAPNTQSGTILFLAHYEHEGSGQSVVDDWSGAIMLPFLYHALSATPRHHTFLFAEVDGEPGAKALFDSFTPAERHAIKGVIALDALGLGPAQFYVDPNDVFTTNYGWGWLQRQLLLAAADQRFTAPLSAIPGGWFKIDDTLEFRHHGIPSILVQSVTFSTRDLPGSARDTASVIDRNTYFNTFVLLAYYAAELDKPWPSPAENAASRPSSRRH
jgi:Peptidase family M28